MKEIHSPSVPVGIEDRLNSLYNKIQELKELAFQILQKDIEQGKGGDENLTFFAMIRYSMELLESMSILIKNSSIDPCKLLLRGYLELYFSLSYLSTGDIKRKAIQFIAHQKYQKLKFYKQLDIDDPSHKEYVARFELDESLGGYPFSQPPNLKNAIAELLDFFKLPVYSKIYEEIERLRKNKEKNPSWYRLFDGPRNIRDLAIKTKSIGLYETHYRIWSFNIHSSAIIEQNFELNNRNYLEILQIKMPYEAESITHSIISISMMFFKAYTRIRLSETDHNLYQKWYISNKEFYSQLTNKQIITRS